MHDHQLLWHIVTRVSINNVLNNRIFFFSFVSDQTKATKLRRQALSEDLSDDDRMVGNHLTSIYLFLLEFTDGLVCLLSRSFARKRLSLPGRKSTCSAESMWHPTRNPRPRTPVTCLTATLYSFNNVNRPSFPNRLAARRPLVKITRRLLTGLRPSKPSMFRESIVVIILISYIYILKNLIN